LSSSGESAIIREYLYIGLLSTTTEFHLFFLKEELMKVTQLTLALSVIIALLFPPVMSAQTFSTQERFQDLFVTAGYGTAFGAAMGAALLSFQERPDESLRYVAVGASLGFISGSLLGSYIVFSPVFQAEKKRDSGLPVALGDSVGRFAIRPTIDPQRRYISRFEGVWTVAQF